MSLNDSIVKTSMESVRVIRSVGSAGSVLNGANFRVVLRLILFV